MQQLFAEYSSVPKPSSWELINTERTLESNSEVVSGHAEQLIFKTAMIYNPELQYNVQEFFSSSNGNIINREALICKPQAVEIPSGRCFIGKDAIIRGDFAAVILNKYCHIGCRAVIRPAYSEIKGFRFIPLTIGSHTYIGEDCVVESAVIGIGCYVGKNSILSKRSILKDFVYIMENSVIPPGSLFLRKYAKNYLFYL